jgi:hypothetical protein
MPAGAGRVLVIGALTLSTLLAGARPALACGCHSGGPVCEAFWKTPVVFSGRVTTINKIAGRSTGDWYQGVRFQVIEAFRGTAATEIELLNYYTSCHVAMPVGTEWLIYAFHDDAGRLSTGTCSRSRRLVEAGEDLSYFRAARTATETRGRIFGRVFYPVDGNTGSRDLQPVPGARVLAERPGGESLSAVTNADGHYEIRAPVGSYVVKVALPRGMTALGPALAELPDAFGCAQVEIWTNYPGGRRAEC